MARFPTETTYRILLPTLRSYCYKELAAQLGLVERLCEFVDMFSGGGGMSLGVREACDAPTGYRFQPVGVFDIDKWALAVYAQNFGLKEIQPTNLAESLSPGLQEEPTDLEARARALTGAR